jgi:hypothetical protein
LRSKDFKKGSTTPERATKFDDHSAERTESNVIDLNLNLDQDESLTNPKNVKSGKN